MIKTKLDNDRKNNKCYFSRTKGKIFSQNSKVQKRKSGPQFSGGVFLPLPNLFLYIRIDNDHDDTGDCGYDDKGYLYIQIRNYIQQLSSNTVKDMHQLLVSQTDK